MAEMKLPVHNFCVTRFACLSKVEYETFHKVKWRAGKKELPLIYMEKNLSVPRPKKITSLRLFW